MSGPDKLARTHTNVSNRLKAKDNAERKAVFKSVLDNPFRIEWPNVHLDVQRQVLADLLSVVSCVSEYFADRSRKSKRKRQAKVGENKMQRKHVYKPEHANENTVPAEHGTAGTSIVATIAEVHEMHHEPPPILRHLTMGINEVTRRLEHQARNSRRKLTVSEGGAVTVLDTRPPIKLVFVCRGDIDSPLLVAHLPHLVAACNSCNSNHSSSLGAVKLVPLPKGAELSLSEAVGFRRVAVLALDDDAPELSKFNTHLKSLPTLIAPWLAQHPMSSSPLVRTHVKQVRTSAPTDMRAAKQRRVQERHAAKRRKTAKSVTCCKDFVLITFDSEMLIAIVGTRFSGRSCIENYLVSLKGFTPIRILNAEGTVNHALPEQDPPLLLEEAMPSDSNLTVDGDSIVGFLNDDTGRVDRFSFLSMGSPKKEHAQIPLEVNWEKDSQQPMCFSSPSQMLDHVTRNWRSNFVTLDLDTRQLVEMFIKRPFFMLVSVDAPLLERYRRSKRHGTISLDAFVQEHDKIMYGITSRLSDSPIGNEDSSLHALRDLVNVHIVNSFSSISVLHRHLDTLDLMNTERLRPSWDTYFMTLASLASRRSNCMKRRVGAILVRRNRIVATGYNGTPRGLPNCNEGGCLPCNSGAPHECICLHAEENALLEVGSDRVGDGSVLYCNTCPCLRCTVKIIQTGVKEVVYNLSYKVDEESARLFKQSGVELRRYNPKTHFSLVADELLPFEDLALLNSAIKFSA